MTPDSNKAFIHWSASGEEADKGLHDEFYGMNMLLFDPKVRALCSHSSFVSAGTSMCNIKAPSAFVMGCAQPATHLLLEGAQARLASVHLCSLTAGLPHHRCLRLPAANGV